MHSHKLLGAYHVWLDWLDQHLVWRRLGMVAGQACELVLWCVLGQVLSFHVVWLHLLHRWLLHAKVWLIHTLLRLWLGNEQWLFALSMSTCSPNRGFV